MRRVNQKEINIPFGSPLSHERRCQFSGCRENGIYRAPVSRDNLNEYYWFCLSHVRAYNLSWNFYAGMSESEIEYRRRNDTVWERPSWPFGRFGEQRAACNDPRGPRYRDSFGFFSQGAEGPARPRPKTDEQRALALLDLEEPVTFQDIKARYKTLVKKLHPDSNGGDTEAEERLKVINQAYAALKISFA